jgi:hypothetical protein
MPQALLPLHVISSVSPEDPRWAPPAPSSPSLASRNVHSGACPGARLLKHRSCFFSQVSQPIA